jgi:hypothetical protein
VPLVLRQGINRLVGGLQSQRSNKERYKDRTLVLANHWDGSVQQFYHFFLGYYMPLSLWLDSRRATKISVRDCGPMNIWFDQLTNSIDLELVPPGSALHAVIGDRTKHVILQGMDDPTKFDKTELRAGLQSIRQQLGISPPDSLNQNKILLVDRATSEDFYHGPESETHMSGRERRHVPNLSDLASETTSGQAIELVDFARMSPREQIQLAQSASTLVGQHGAGLVHMLWMPAGSTVIEIAPPLPQQVEHIFERLAHVMGHKYTRVLQEGVHAPVELTVLQQLLSQ